MITLQPSGRTISAALALSALVLASSCKKDKDPSDTPPPGKKITRFASDANNYTAFTYNAQGRLQKMKVSIGLFQEPFIMETTIHYDGSKIKEMVTTEEGKTVITYTGNYPSKSEDFDEEGNAEGYDEITWVSGKLSQTITYEKDGANFLPVAKTTYEYYANGNLKTKKIYSYVSGDDGFELDSRTEYEQYDNKIDPISFMNNLTAFVDLSYRPNNATMIKYYDGENSLYYTVQKTYEYDNQGYPVKVTEKFISGDDEDITVSTYTY